QVVKTIEERTKRSHQLMSKFEELRQSAAVASRDGDRSSVRHYSQQALERLNEVGELGVLWPRGVIPEDLAESVIEPFTQYTEKLRRSNQLQERSTVIVQRWHNSEVNGEEIENFGEEL